MTEGLNLNKMHLPNLLTLLRFLLAPLLPAAWYLLPSPQLAAAALLLLAMATDFLDGFLARRWQQTSLAGAVLDPTADKLMVALALFLLLDSHGGAALGPGLLIILREFLIAALRSRMAGEGRREKVAVAWPGKVKTGLQWLAILPLLLITPQSALAGYFHLLLWLAAIWTLGSAWPYLRRAGAEGSKLSGLHLLASPFAAAGLMWLAWLLPGWQMTLFATFAASLLLLYLSFTEWRGAKRHAAETQQPLHSERAARVKSG